MRLACLLRWAIRAINDACDMWPDEPEEPAEDPTP